jgi:hypothetical protein
MELLLIEDFRGEDWSQPRGVSGYSLLLALIRETREELSKTIAYDEVVQLEKRAEKAMETHHRLEGSFREQLESVGAQSGARRRVRCLYRLRDLTGYDELSRHGYGSILAYPIVVEESGMGAGAHS